MGPVHRHMLHALDLVSRCIVSSCARHRHKRGSAKKLEKPQNDAAAEPWHEMLYWWLTYDFCATQRETYIYSHFTHKNILQLLKQCLLLHDVWRSRGNCEHKIDKSLLYVVILSMSINCAVKTILLFRIITEFLLRFDWFGRLVGCKC